MYKKIIKPLFDIVFSLILIITFFPLFIIMSILIKIELGSPIIYKQERVGKNKKSFIMYKFRTMKENSGSYLERTTKLTRFLRNIGIDELPQLFNILKQDMSFVGPRPFILNEQLPNDKIDDIIYSVKPGVTGLASSMGRREVTHKKRLEYDVEYVKKISLWLDIKIVLKTIKVLIEQNIKR